MTREEMIAKLQAHDQETQKSSPSKEQMIAKLQAHDQAQTPEGYQPFTNTSLATSTAHTLLKPFDYASGITRTGLAEAVGHAKGQPDLVKPEDWQKTWQGNAPPLDEYAARAGIPEGPRLSEALPALYSETGEGLPLKKGGAFDPSVRGAASLGVTMATDPLTYIAPGARAASSVGKTMWTKALQPLDRAAEAAGKGVGAVSGLAMREGIATGPTMRANMEQLAEHAGKLYDRQQALLEKAGQAGSTIDPAEVTSPLREMAAKYGKLPDAGAQEFAKNLADKATLIEAKLSAGPVTPQTLSELKTFWGKDIPQGKWAEYAQTGLGDEAKQAQYRGAKTATEQAVDRTLPGSGNELKSVNQDLGTLLSTRKKQLGEVGKEEAKKHITAVDGMIGGLAAGERAAGEMGSSNSHGIMALIKKAIDLKNAAGPASYIGSRMYKLGQSLTPAEEEAARQILINAAQPEPWGRIYEQRTKEGSP